MVSLAIHTDQSMLFSLCPQSKLVVQTNVCAYFCFVVLVDISYATILELLLRLCIFAGPTAAPFPLSAVFMVFSRQSMNASCSPVKTVPRLQWSSYLQLWVTSRPGGREGNSKLCSEIKLALTAGPACHTEHEQEYRAVGSSHLSRPVNTMRQILEKYVNNLQVPVEKHKLENCSLDAVIFDWSCSILCRAEKFTGSCHQPGLEGFTNCRLIHQTVMWWPGRDNQIMFGWREGRACPTFKARDCCKDAGGCGGTDRPRSKPLEPGLHARFQLNNQ